MEHMNFKPGWKILLILLSGIFLSLDIQAQRIKVHGNVKDSLWRTCGRSEYYSKRHNIRNSN